jgi:UDP-hydrolysing UDP-N-acetyl-D-glucosamine 2-epimerase
LLDRYGNVADEIEADGFRVDARAYMVLEGENPTAMAKTTGLGLLELSTIFGYLRPDVVLSVADRYETMATAIAAAYTNLPLFHVQGGEVTGSIDEKVRHAITKLADLHLVATDQAAERVMRMGEAPSSVFVTGCPSIDLAARVLDDPKLDFDPFERYQGVGPRPALAEGYLVLFQHPVTTEYESARRHVTETLAAVHESGIPTLWFWPNSDAGADGTSDGIRGFQEEIRPDTLHFFTHMAHRDFLKLLCNAVCVVGNSSVGIRECSFLAVPAVNIGTRQAGRERGRNVIDVGYDRRAILDAIRQHQRAGLPERDTLYGDGEAGVRIAKHLARWIPRIEKKLAY